MTDPAQAAREFVAWINRHDVAGLAGLMTPDHRLIDAGGAEITGIEPLQAAWHGYFNLVPDYWIALDEILTQGDTVVLLGRAGGTCAPDGQRSPARQWQVPAAWRAVVRDGRISEWQVYADNEPLRALMRASAPPPRWLFLMAVPVLAFAFWIMLQAYTSPAVKECQAGYHAARNAADTARVDSLVPKGSADPHSCGFIRSSARWQ